MFGKKQPPTDPNKEAIAKHVRAADILARSAKFEEALFEINRALELDPKNYYAQSLKQRISAQAEKLQDKISQQEDQERRKTEEIAKLLKNAEQYIEYRQYKLALEEVSKVYKIDPHNYMALAYSDRIEELMLQEGQKAATQEAASNHVPAQIPTSEVVPTSREARLDLYRQLLKECWADGVLNEGEQQELAKVRGLFHISTEEHQQLEREVHVDSYVEALRIAWRDGMMSKNEEQVLQIMRKKYNISMEDHVSAEAKILWVKSYPHAKGTILVVDDEKTVLLPLSLQLQRHGYDVMKAESVEQALELLNQTMPSLIISDLMFPGGLNGLDFYQRVRQDPNLKSVPFLLMSGISDDFVVRAGLRMGVDNFIRKPFDLEALLAVIEGRLSSTQNDSSQQPTR